MESWEILNINWAEIDVLDCELIVRNGLRKAKTKRYSFI